MCIYIYIFIYITCLNLWLFRFSAYLAFCIPGDLLQSTNFSASASLQGRVSRQLGSAPKRISVFTWRDTFLSR